MVEYPFRFQPHKQGINAVLGDLESKVMTWLWANDQGTVKQAQKGLQLDPEPAYTTIMTIMSRLAEKGLLQKEKHGNAFVYRPTLTQAQFQKKMIRKIMGSLIDSFGSPALTHFVETVNDEVPEKMDELAALIEAARSHDHD